MAHGRNKYQSRESRARIRKVLMRQWDPIGVAYVPEAADEYDDYVGKVYVMLMEERATADQIAAYLLKIASEWMGLGHSEEIADRSVAAAKAIFDLRPTFETH